MSLEFAPLFFDTNSFARFAKNRNKTYVAKIAMLLLVAKGEKKNEVVNQTGDRGYLLGTV